ncbi:MAG: hypothetical protein HZA83_01620, partial [Thaumarchaeota archaeon]|nr:hypothetical protein [Nitrososphaerota archaeon]
MNRARKVSNRQADSKINSGIAALAMIAKRGPRNAPESIEAGHSLEEIKTTQTVQEIKVEEQGK